MSRTDKDVPYRIRVTRTEEHRCASHFHERIGDEMYRPYLSRGQLGEGIIFTECDIDNPVRPGDQRRLCQYHLPRWVYSWFEHPSAVERRSQWHKPDRAATRVGLSSIARSFTGSDDIDELNDDTVRVEQHRGRAALGGGYWD